LHIHFIDDKPTERKRLRALLDCSGTQVETFIPKPTLLKKLLEKLPALPTSNGRACAAAEKENL
jgi:hypothetical protein